MARPEGPGCGSSQAWGGWGCGTRHAAHSARPSCITHPQGVLKPLNLSQPVGGGAHTGQNSSETVRALGPAGLTESLPK